MHPQTAALLQGWSVKSMVASNGVKRSGNAAALRWYPTWAHPVHGEERLSHRQHGWKASTQSSHILDFDISDLANRLEGHHSLAFGVWRLAVYMYGRHLISQYLYSSHWVRWAVCLLRRLSYI